VLISSFFFFFPYKQARDPWEVALRALHALQVRRAMAVPSRHPTIPRRRLEGDWRALGVTCSPS
jgi:hypothetical protein